MRDLIKYSISNLLDRKLRSYLTVLSILVGIAAIYALVSFGQGITIYMNKMAQEQGSDKLWMMPKGFSAPGTSNIVFTNEDVDFVRKIKGVDKVAAMITASVKVKFKDYREKYVYASGIPTDVEEQRLLEETGAIEIEKGRGLKKGDVFSVVLGYNYQIPNKLFKRPIAVGDKIEINDIPVRVVGFYSEVGNNQDDSNVYFTFDGAKELIGKEDYEYIFIQSSPGQDTKELADKINDKYRKRKGQAKGEEDFFVQTFEDAIATFTSIITILNGILFLIALISVVVASVNTMNTMYTSVLERTREIGVMKSIGAQNKTILMVFVIESGLLGLAGGTFGVLLGFGLAKLGGLIAKMSGLAMLQPAFPIWLTLGCLVFASLVGALSGLLPALQASKLNPVDALRYE